MLHDTLLGCSSRGCRGTVHAGLAGDVHSGIPGHVSVSTTSCGGTPRRHRCSRHVAVQAGMPENACSRLFSVSDGACRALTAVMRRSRELLMASMGMDSGRRDNIWSMVIWERRARCLLYGSVRACPLSTASLLIRRRARERLVVV